MYLRNAIKYEEKKVFTNSTLFYLNFIKNTNCKLDYGIFLIKIVLIDFDCRALVNVMRGLLYWT